MILSAALLSQNSEVHPRGAVGAEVGAGRDDLLFRSPRQDLGNLLNHERPLGVFVNREARNAKSGRLLLEVSAVSPHKLGSLPNREELPVRQRVVQHHRGTVDDASETELLDLPTSAPRRSR